MLITRVEDVAYLSGFTGEDSCLLLVGRGAGVLITDGRYDQQARRECPDLEVLIRTGPMGSAIAAAARDHGVKRLGFQGGHVPVLFSEKLAGLLDDVVVTPVGENVAELRKVKDDDEIRAIRKAVRIAERAFRELIAPGADALVGRREREIAAELDYRMRLAGADGASFETIVAAGAHASLPHYRPGGARVKADQAVLIDWGASVEGYVSDLTRVLLPGRIPPKLIEAYEVVRLAQAAGIAAVRPGVCSKSADAAAREVIEASAFRGTFRHGLGHGIGRDVHESPALSPRSDARLRKGMVVTVEPGVYLPGVGGIRIEDDVLVTGDGAKRLSTLARTAAAMTLR